MLKFEKDDFVQDTSSIVNDPSLSGNMSFSDISKLEREIWLATLTKEYIIFSKILSIVKYLRGLKTIMLTFYGILFLVPTHIQHQSVI